MSNTSLLTTVIGWTVVIGLGGLIWFYSKSPTRAKPQPPTKQTSKTYAERKEPRAKKLKNEGGLSSGDQDTKSIEKTQKKKVQVPTKVDQKQESVGRNAKDSDDDDDIRKFAQQLSQAQAGTKLSGKPVAASRQKSVKQSRAQEKQAKESGNLTAGSATGGDADDDQSLPDSPEVGPTGGSNGVADMLEAPAPGPSVLRLTEPTNPKPAKKEKPKAAPAPVETKKQRQNRQKREEAKAMREEDEKERKVLEERQRRTAREAEGRAPKDGRQFMASQNATPSVWTAPTNNGSTSSTGNVDLLDTTEDTPVSKPVVSKQPGNTRSGAGYADDDEQMKFAIEESREWEQVSNKKQRKPKKKEANDGEGAGTASSTDEKEFTTAPPAATRSQPASKPKRDPYVDRDANLYDVKTDVQDSEWVVA